MRTLYTNTCPAWHDTKKISKDKWLQNLRGEGASSTAGGRVVFEDTEVRHHDTRQIILQKINQNYCDGATPGAPVENPCLTRIREGLIAYWDANSIPDTDDVAGRIIDLGAAVTSVPGKIGNAWEFSNYPTSHLTTPDDAALRLFGTDFTVRFWIKFLTLNLGTAYDLIVKYDTSSFSGWGVKISASGNLLFLMGNGSTILSAGSLNPLTTGGYYHVVIKYSAGPPGSITFYINSSNLGTTTNSQLIMASSTVALRVGNPFSEPDDFFWNLDELGIWNFTWTDCEVLTDFKNAQGLTYPFEEA